MTLLAGMVFEFLVGAIGMETVLTCSVSTFRANLI